MNLFGMHIRPLYVLIFTFIAILVNLAQCGLQLSAKDRYIKPDPDTNYLSPKSLNEYRGIIRDKFFYTSVNYFFDELPKSIKVIEDQKSAKKSALINKHKTIEQRYEVKSNFYNFVAKFKNNSSEYNQNFIPIIIFLLLFGWLPVSLEKNRDSLFSKFRFILLIIIPVIMIIFSVADYFISIKYNTIIFDNNSQNEYKISINNNKIKISPKKWIRIVTDTGENDIKIVSDEKSIMLDDKIYVPKSVSNLIYNINSKNEYFRDEAGYYKQRPK